MPYQWPADTDFALWELDVLDRGCVVDTASDAQVSEQVDGYDCNDCRNGRNGSAGEFWLETLNDGIADINVGNNAGAQPEKNLDQRHRNSRAKADL